MNRFLGRALTLFRSMDWWFCGAIIFLLSIGLAMQYSIGLNQEVASLSQFNKQLLFVLVGALFFVASVFVDYRILKTHPAVYIALGVIVLVSVLLFGTTLKGATGWFVIGSISIQPVEFAKIFFILCMAVYFDKDMTLMQRPKYFFVTGAIAAVFVGLTLLQPDTGSAFILFMIWVSYVLVLKAPKRYVMLIPVALCLAILAGWFFLFSPYQKDRLSTFIHPSANPQTTGYNVAQSIVAVGSGSFWGRGLGLGTQSQLHFLPEVTSDFIFAAIAEELGFVGVVAICGAFALILFRLWVYMSQAKDQFSFLCLLGIFTYMAVQTFLVIGMNIGLLPVTGLPLPLISAGGSSMIVTLALLSLAHAMRKSGTVSSR